MNASGADGTLNQSKEGANAGGQEDNQQNDFWTDKVFDEEEIMNSAIFLQQAQLLDDPKLKDNEMHRKLCVRLAAFYVNQEKIRLCGLTESQKEAIRKSGFSNSYRQQLHKSLRTMLLQIVSEKDIDMKLRQLRETYSWYIDKLIAMGALSDQEKQQEFLFLNPNADSMKVAMRDIVKNKMRSALCDEDAVAAHKASMYEDQPYKPAERTKHPDIPPPEVRISQYRRQGFGKKLNEKVDEVKMEDYKLLRQRET